MITNARMQHARIGIIGGGVAGLACAYFLAQRGIRDFVVWESAPMLGSAASGRSAAMGRQFSLSAYWMPLAAHGMRFLYAPPPLVSEHPLITPIGSLLIYPRTQLATVTAHLQLAHHHNIPATLIRASEAAARVPQWNLTDDDCVLVWTPSDGIVDVERLVAGLAQATAHNGAGTICTSTAVRSVVRTDTGWLLDTSTDAWQVDVLVNAAGAWGDVVAHAAGIAPIGLQSFARRISVCAAARAAQSAAAWPFVWDHRHELYVRPEISAADDATGDVASNNSTHVWCSACEEVAVQTWDPATINTAIPLPTAQRALQEKCRATIPTLVDAPVLRSWTGVRTFTPSRTAYVAWDAGGAPFFWLCGLGGHGITCATRLGQLAAEQIVERVG